MASKFELKGYKEMTTDKYVREIDGIKYTIKAPTLRQWGEYNTFEANEDDLSIWSVGQLVEGETIKQDHLAELVYVCRSIFNLGIVEFIEYEKETEEKKDVEETKPEKKIKMMGGAETKTVAQFPYILATYIKYLGLSKEEALNSDFFANQKLVESFEVFRERDKMDNIMAIRTLKMLESKEGISNYKSFTNGIQKRVEKGSYRQITLKADMSILEMLKAQQAGGRNG